MDIDSLLDQECEDKCIQEVLRVAHTYSQSCGVQCRFFDSKKNPFNLILHNSCNCAKCDDSTIGASAHNKQNSTRSSSYGNTHLYSNHLGGQIVWLNVHNIQNGLTCWSSSILKGCEMIGTLVAGPVQMVEPFELQTGETLTRCEVTRNVLYELNSQMNEIPIMTAERVKSLSEMLCMATLALSKDASFKFETQADHYRLQDGRCEQIIQINRQDKIGESGSAYPIEKENQLLAYVENGDKSGAQEVLNEILGAVFFANETSRPAILTRITELTVLLSRAAIRGGANMEQIFGQNFACLNKIHSFRTVDEIAYWLSGILANFTAQVLNRVDVRYADSISKAKTYIKENYMTRITLEDVAAEVYLSPAYFSRIFKEITGKNFNVYVNEIRIDAAKKYLVDEKIPMSNISVSTGFEDQSYFSKVFKRMTGVTPNKYRESRGKTIRN